MVAGPKTTTWPLAPHTRAKHELLRRYLGAWFPILGRYNGRVVFFDGFAGPGIYNDGEPGSPIIALDTLLGHQLFPKMACEFVFAFLDNDERRVASLRTEVDAFATRRHGLPKNVKVEIGHTSFERGAAELLETLEQQKAKLAPTFAFVDPFGVSGVPMDLLARLLAFDRCEVFCNFIYNTVNRFAAAGNIDAHLTALYGTDRYREAARLSGKDRKRFLHDLYGDQLQSECGFRYVQRFEVLNKTGHTGYSLFYGTRHMRGLEVMKEAMWRVDPGGGLRFSDRLADQDVLFQVTPDFGPLRAELLRHFAGQEVSVEAIKEYTLVHTPYSGSHWNRPVLNPLEKDDAIKVVTSPRKRRGVFPPGTIVRFPA